MGKMAHSSSRRHVTAVILSYNSLGSLVEVIEAVKRQSYPVAGIIVVDNGSSDGTQARLEERYQALTLVFLDENQGVGAGHSYGWQIALQNPACDFIWSLEHDAVPAEDCLVELMEAYERHPQPISLGAICPTPVADHATIGRRGTYRWKNNRLIRIEAPTTCGEPAPSRTLTFNGTLFPARVMRTVGFLNSDLFLGHEDFEYAHRLKQRGLQLLIVPSATIAHDILKSCKTIYVFDYAFILPNQSLVRAYYGHRNGIFIQKLSRSSIRLALNIALKLPVSIILILLLKDHKLRRIQARFFSIRDGLGGSLGRKSYSFLQLPSQK